jgi:glycosyltransferase involved in cell wall biosynthesis
MRVLMVTPSYYPIQGGAETVVRDLSIELNKMEVQTDILTFNMNRKWNPSWQAKNEKADGINVFKIPALDWFPLAHSDRITLGINLIPGRFRNHLRKYDIIHFHGGDLTFPLFSYTIKKPKIFHFHGISVDFYKRYFLSRLILKNIANRYICLTKLMEREMIELGFPKNKIIVLPNGVNTRLFHPSKERKDNLVLFVGRISREKGLHVLLKSLAYFKKSTNLVIIGPPSWDLEYFENAIRLIREENKRGKHKVTYLCAQDHRNMIEWYRKASILVLPSFREGLPVVILEALACETPVVTTNVGGIPEVLCNSEGGIMVPPNEVTKLAEAIQFLLDNENIRTKFGRQGRELVIKNFSIDAVVKELHKIYKQMTFD